MPYANVFSQTSTSINDFGDVAGIYTDYLSGLPHQSAYTYSTGQGYTAITPNDNTKYLTSATINNQKQVAGRYQDTTLATTTTNGIFISQNGQAPVFVAAGNTATNTFTDSIIVQTSNNSISGVISSSGGDQPFVYTAPAGFNNPLTSAQRAQVSGLIDTNDVGTSLFTGVNGNSLFYQSGTLNSVGQLTGFQTTQARDINNHNIAVGTASQSSALTSTAFITALGGGVVTDLNTLIDANSGYQLTGTRFIDDLGNIIATAQVGNRTDFVRLTPRVSGTAVAGEPSSLGLLTFSLALAACRKRRKPNCTPN